MKTLCLFDLDGTLIDPYEAMTKGLQYALASQGVEITDRRQFIPYIGPPLRETLREFAKFTDEDKIEAMVKAYREHFLQEGIYENPLYPGVSQMLETLKNAGIPMAIATSKYIESAIKVVEYLKIDHYFETIVGSELDGSRSRKAEVIECVLDEIDPKRQYLPVMIGDRKYDIIGAKETESVHVKSIGITWGYGSQEELQQENPDMVIDTVENLVATLLNM